MPSHAFLEHDGLLAFAHRGDGEAAPENTAAAFESAVGLGFRYLETDVHCTRDGVLIAFHDDRLDRVTDQRGSIARLDYADVVRLRCHTDIDAFFEEASPERAFMFSTKHTRRHSDCRFRAGDALVFGPETRGLPKNIRLQVPDECRVTLPMCPSSRSLNLANAVSVAVFEAWRQCGYPDSA